MVVANRTSTGLVYRADFATTTGWTLASGFASVADPQLATFGALPSLGGPTGIGSTPACDGEREGQLYVEAPDDWYLIFGGGSGKPGSGWRQHLKRSRDRGLTWNYLGPMPEGVAKIGGGNLGACDVGWLEKRGGTYYRHRVTAGNQFDPPNHGLPAIPYGWDIWKTTNSLASMLPWTPVREQGITPGTWSDGDTTPGCTVFDGTNWHHFLQSSSSYPGVIYAGRASMTGPDSAHTVDPTPIASRLIPAFANRYPENPKVFWHAGVSRWVMLVNLIATDGLHTDANGIGLSASLTDWSAATWVRTQRKCPLDTLLAVGLAAHVTGPDGALVSDADLGTVPITFDGNPARYAPGWHLGRSVLTTVLEPFSQVLRYTSSDTTTRLATRNVTHADGTIECVFRFRAATGNAGLIFRRQANGDHYRFMLLAGGRRSVLEKVVGGSGTTLAAITSGVQTIEQDQHHRVRITLAGSKITCLIDGEVHASVSDSTWAGGTSIGFAAADIGSAGVDLFGLSVVSGSGVAVSGLTPGAGVVLRGAGGIPLCATVADASGNATIPLSHGPASLLEVAGQDYPAQGGIWPGDVLAFSGLPSTAARATLRRALSL